MATETPSTNNIEKKAGAQKPGTTKRRDGEKITKDKLNALLTQARNLQWAGQHTKAIEVCTQALDVIGKGNARIAQLQWDFINTRAESHFTRLNIEAIQDDVKVMMQIAEAAPSSPKEKKSVLKI